MQAQLITVNVQDKLLPGFHNMLLYYFIVKYCIQTILCDNTTN